MLEAIAERVSWEAVAGVVAAVWALWRARKVHKALEEWGQFQRAVADARSEASPAGKAFTQNEVEVIVEQGTDVLRALSPIFGRAFGRK